MKPSLTKSQIIHWSLYALIIVLVGATSYGAYFLHTMLSNYVTKVDHLKIDSEVNEQGIANALKLRKVLDENKSSVERAASIVADTKYYEYQNQIVSDITSYATAANLTVLGFDFSPTATTSASPTSSVKGVKTVVATVSLKSPVNYLSYLRFLKLIEKNLTKMQVTQLDISNDLKTTGAISSPVVTLEVFVR